MKNQNPLSISIEEKYLQSKTGRLEDCEDLIHVSDFFVAVIDGATSKTERRWGNKTGGQVAARLIDEALGELDPCSGAEEATQFLTSKLLNFYEEKNSLEIVKRDPNQRLTASVVILSLCRKEIWLVGDCQFMINNKLFVNTKPIDKLLSEIRSLFLTLEMAGGKSVKELTKFDEGREFIMPLLKRQPFLQNRPETGPYWYPVIDGFPVPPQGIIVKELPPNTDTVILASDGYPFLKDNLSDSEGALKDLLENDPLLKDRYKSTKGLTDGNVSFDDRAFIKIEVKK